MRLDDVFSTVEDCDRGAELELLHPVTNVPTGLKMTLAGPDSETQRRARLTMLDRIGELAMADGRVSAEHREAESIAMLARCVLRWDIAQDGQPLPLTHDNAVRLLSVSWVREQADAFAGTRANFIKGAA
ncbi:hypothetical protein [Pararhizobium sp.]|uniref:hypothetical protein n=1 Tax=Pararhizobium sp. TaxID=1977563 RepID=UPI003D0BEB07